MIFIGDDGENEETEALRGIYLFIPVKYFVRLVLLCDLRDLL
jgi:hypothetical protein